MHVGRLSHDAHIPVYIVHIVPLPWQQDMWSQMKVAGVPLSVSLYNTMISVHLYNKQPFSPKVSAYNSL